MKTLEELQKEYAAERKAYEKIKAEHVAKCEEIKAAVIALAKYKVGDRVICTDKTWRTRGDNTQGIIRTVQAMARYGDELNPCYRVAKLTKHGAPHAAQDISYSEINEEDLVPCEGKPDGH
jgi:hypothetical protein